ncbi:short-chain fatty acid transporter [Paenirhodobacter populi]|uniref:Short-chain fatty acid transporter n=1 Tax=Paenirhodobacter populi TaxID=2306993 RepID=A0A443IRP9_9RHOB|nr:TIGR00366 family protein [Sinirhodobacter populi]RWR09533.1 short-chain fatty acid transporter [Sinirhodobacter populi]RWR20482.1 short-chain fatty acid transporter [Sinirhodobacter populi]RWR26653.1 short-chain fatty acid transporter [Sinirhodobacter populi]
MITDTRQMGGGSFLWRLSKKFDFAAEKIIPDPLVFCLIFTLVLFVCGVLFTGSTPLDMAQYWYDGIWSQIAFAFQMSFMVVCCAVAARSPQIAAGLDRLAGLARTPISAVLLLMVFGYLASFVNWAFALIVTPVLAMALSKRIPGLHFPMLIAAGYSTMILGQCLSPTGTVFALLASPEHFLAGKIGVIPQTETTYNPANIVIWVILASITVLIAVMALPPTHQVVEFRSEAAPAPPSAARLDSTGESLADRMNGSRLIMWAMGLLGVTMIVYTIVSNGLFSSLTLNFVIFVFLILNFFLYNTPEKFITAYRDNLKLATDVMIQFPFYGGIAGMMAQSGMAVAVVGFFTSLSTAETMPLYTYYATSFVNLFIPSQGGQWIVQGDMTVDAAMLLGADLNLVVNAFVYGDQATNLLQPLYVIPALAVVGMRLRDVWGYMAFLWCIWFVVTSVALLVIPRFF